MSEGGAGQLRAAFRVAATEAAALETLLFTHGAAAVTLSDAGDDPLLEPDPGQHPLWPHVVLSAWFEDDRHLNAACTAAAALMMSVPTVERVADHDWRDIPAPEPLTFGGRLQVVPADYDLPPPADHVQIRIAPGLAFGTGLHATTALCLRFLAGLESLTGSTMTDYGCGSGILALAALKMGADRALAIDHDPQALEATRANAKLNDFAGELDVCAVSPLAPATCDLLVANILLGPLGALAPSFSRHLKPGASIAMSGILPEQVETLRAGYGQDFGRWRSDEFGGWALLAGRRKPMKMG